MTTRIVSCLVGNPNLNLHLPLLLRRGTTQPKPMFPGKVCLQQPSFFSRFFHKNIFYPSSPPRQKISNISQASIFTMVKSNRPFSTIVCINDCPSTVTPRDVILNFVMLKSLGDSSHDFCFTKTVDLVFLFKRPKQKRDVLCVVVGVRCYLGFSFTSFHNRVNLGMCPAVSKNTKGRH